MHLERAFAAHKNQLSLACLPGFGFLFRLLTRQSSVSDIQHRCEQILGCNSAVISNCEPERAFDIDGLIDYRNARKPFEEFVSITDRS